MKDIIKQFFQGDVEDNVKELESHSRDASLFQVMPELVVYPKDTDDIQNLVQWVGKEKSKHPRLSLTARSAGTCMSGGSLNDSIIVDVTRHMNTINEVAIDHATAQPGVYYRDFEKRTLEQGVLMPAYTASRDICALGGMFANNSGGEKTIKYGKVENFVNRSKIIFSDGKEYEVKPLDQTELAKKMSQGDFEGEVYRGIMNLIQNNLSRIKRARPNVSKNSAGYYLWNVWNQETGIFDLNKLLVGSQGTLGIVTEVEWKLIPREPSDKMLVMFLDDTTRLGELVDTIMPYQPDSLESYDDYSLKLALKFWFDFVRQLGLWRALGLAFRFIPELWMTLTGGVPKLIVIAEFTGADDYQLTKQVVKLEREVKEKFNLKTRIPKKEAGEEKYWTVRHESFNLLRKHVKGRRTAPFVDDVVVAPKHLPKFLPRLTALLDEYNLLYTIAGHAGDGNFHIIPLMDMKKNENREIILELSQKVYDLVLEYQGSITAEHNDGIIRTPYLEQMYGTEMVELFQQVKNIFDPQNIFNPGKKVGGTKDDILKYLATNN